MSDINKAREYVSDGQLKGNLPDVRLYYMDAAVIEYEKIISDHAAALRQARVDMAVSIDGVNLIDENKKMKERIAELEKRGIGYSQETVDALTKERDTLQTQLRDAESRGYNLARMVCIHCCYEKGKRIENVTYAEARVAQEQEEKK